MRYKNCLERDAKICILVELYFSTLREPSSLGLETNVNDTKELSLQLKAQASLNFDIANSKT